MKPKHCYDNSDSSIYNDEQWIAEKLDQLPISMQKKVCSKYSDIYLQLSNEDPFKCRYRANTWLRKIVDKNKVVYINDGRIF